MKDQPTNACECGGVETGRYDVNGNPETVCGCNPAAQGRGVGEDSPALPWRDISELEPSDDEHWFLRKDGRDWVVDGPRATQNDGEDEEDGWQWFAPCESPPIAALTQPKGIELRTTEILRLRADLKAAEQAEVVASQVCDNKEAEFQQARAQAIREALSLPRQSEAEPASPVNQLPPPDAVEYPDSGFRADVDALRIWEANMYDTGGTPYWSADSMHSHGYRKMLASKAESESLVPNIGVGVDVSSDGVAVTVVHRQGPVDTVIYSEVHPFTTPQPAQADTTPAAHGVGDGMVPAELVRRYLSAEYAHRYVRLQSPDYIPTRDAWDAARVELQAASAPGGE